MSEESDNENYSLDLSDAEVFFSDNAFLKPLTPTEDDVKQTVGVKRKVEQEPKKNTKEEKARIKFLHLCLTTP
jgi:hypothetical protein